MANLIKEIREMTDIDAEVSPEQRLWIEVIRYACFDYIDPQVISHYKSARDWLFCSSGVSSFTWVCESVFESLEMQQIILDKLLKMGREGTIFNRRKNSLTPYGTKDQRLKRKLEEEKRRELC